MEKQKKKKFTIYTDGSCDNIETGIGGWAYVILDEDEEIYKEGSGNMLNTTNNQMELTAICNALIECPFESKIVLFSDSKYSIGVLSNNNWNPKANIDIISKCQETINSLSLNIDFKWVKSHNGIYWNEYVDKKANEAYSEIASKIPKEEKIVCVKKEPYYKINNQMKESVLCNLVRCIEEYQETRRKADEMVNNAHKKYQDALDEAKKIVGKLSNLK